MIKLIAKFAATALLLCLSATSSAGLITDTKTQYVKLDNYKWTSTSSVYSYAHDLRGYDFLLGSAESSWLTIDIIDDNKGGDDRGFFQIIETIVFVIEDIDFDTGTFTFGSGFDSALEMKALASLNSTGILNVTVKAFTGDFYVGNSVLTVNTADVPEPATALLLGLGLLGFGAQRLRKSRL